MLINLPKNDADCARMIRRHANRMADYLSYRHTQWLLAWYYLNGFRRFDTFNPETGLITPFYLDEEGRMEFQSQELLYNINQVAGAIQSMDLTPAVTTTSTSLADLRDRALSQIMLDGTISNVVHDRAKEEFAWMFSELGFAGITGHITSHPTIGITTDLEVIHPKEIIPFPAQGEDHTKVSGIIRERYLPIEKVEELFGKKVPVNRDDIEYFEVDPGEAWASGDELATLGGGGGTRGNKAVTGSPSKVKGKETILVVLIRELWTFTQQNTVHEYVVATGDVVLRREDMSDYEVYCPIGWARFMNNGTFHGAGMFDLLFSQHRQLELLQKNLYNNIRDADRYGVLLLPQGDIDKDNFIRDMGHGLKLAFWEPHPISEGVNPTVIQPFSTGDLPGKVAQFAREGLQLINPIRDILEEKGRVDSAPGLQMLQEQVSKALTSPTSGVQKAWGEMYRSSTQRVAAAMVKEPQALPVGRLSLDLAGAIIDPKTGFVSFNDNPIPSIRNLIFGVRDLSPKSATARKMEALELFDRGLDPDPINFKLMAIEEGLDFPLWMRREKGSYERAVKLILTAYGDGEVPGEVRWTPEFIDPEITLRLLESFIKGPAMDPASIEVRLLFRKLRMLLMAALGQALPEGMQNPDDLAEVGMGGMIQDPLAMGGEMGGDPGMMGGMGGPPMQGAPPEGPPQAQGMNNAPEA